MAETALQGLEPGAIKLAEIVFKKGAAASGIFLQSKKGLPPSPSTTRDGCSSSSKLSKNKVLKEDISRPGIVYASNLTPIRAPGNKRGNACITGRQIAAPEQACAGYPAR